MVFGALGFEYLVGDRAGNYNSGVGKVKQDQSHEQQTVGTGFALGPLTCDEHSECTERDPVCESHLNQHSKRALVEEPQDDFCDNLRESTSYGGLTIAELMIRSSLTPLLVAELFKFFH